MPNILVVIAALGSGLIAGVFFAFSTFVMTALGKLPPYQGIAAMQSINIDVINPLFMIAFMGTAVLAVYLGFVNLRHGLEIQTIWILAAAALYVVGSVAVTMIFNVPLNNALAAADPVSDSSKELWAQYQLSWTFWNHIRGLTAALASLSYMRAL